MNQINKMIVALLLAFTAFGNVCAQETAKKDTTALGVVGRYFDKQKAGGTPKELSGFFAENAEYYIPGDFKNVPWIGKRVGPKEIEEAIRLLKTNVQTKKASITDIVSKGNRVVVLGAFESIYKKNGQLMKSEFSIDIVVKNGLISRFHLLEDSFEVSRVAKEKQIKSKLK